jgi:FkbM family methyltransferase
LLAVASKLDSMGLRPLIAKAATLAYPRQTFSVDAEGRWINSQPECTIASPVIYTTPFAHFRDWVMDNWAYCYTPKTGDVLVDLGTGIGEEAVIFSSLIGREGLMIAVEAHPETFQCLLRTVAMSRLSNVRPVNCAIADKDGETRIGGGPSHLTHSIGRGDNLIPQMTLDTLTRDLDRIDFLRTNIEGAEKLMIRGMKDSIHKVQNVCISCHDFLADDGRNENFRSKAEVVPFLEQAGFEIITRPGTPPPMRDYVYGVRHSPPSARQS